MIKPAGKQSIDVGRVDPPQEYTMTDMDVRTSYRVSGERNNSDHVRHVGLGRGIVKKMGPPSYKEVFTSTKVSMAGFTVSGIQSETSYLERTWPLFAAKELKEGVPAVLEPYLIKSFRMESGYFVVFLIIL
jgi:hypothetical protein